MVSFILFALGTAVAGALTGAAWVVMDALKRRLFTRHRIPKRAID